MSTEPIISVLVADDEEDQRVLIETLLRNADGLRHLVTTVPDGHSALAALREKVFDVALLDLSMPGLDGLEVLEGIAGDPVRPQVIFVSGHGTVSTATRAMKLGAYDFVEKPVERDRLLTLVWKAAAARRIQAKSERLEAMVRRDAGGVRIVTEDPRMLEALALVERVAPSDASVLVTGESGTGKELIARELHRLSGREEEPLVALNCAAVSEALAESELFGHEKGAFTGASGRKIGLIELADGGTLFLDEIGDLPAGLQAKLLRVLETRVFRRVGGVKEIPTSFRLVSATNRPLQDLVEDGSFRGDLFYRINAIVIPLPPLRERPDDIVLLARHFLEEFRPGGWRGVDARARGGGIAAELCMAREHPRVAQRGGARCAAQHRPHRAQFRAGGARPTRGHGSSQRRSTRDSRVAARQARAPGHRAGAARGRLASGPGRRTPGDLRPHAAPQDPEPGPGTPPLTAARLSNGDLSATWPNTPCGRRRRPFACTRLPARHGRTGGRLPALPPRRAAPSHPW